VIPEPSAGRPAGPQSPSAPEPLRCVLTIATSDSGAGAGLQADLKTFAALKVYGLSAVSAVTAQNSLAVTALECLSPAMVRAQLLALDDDFPIGAIKIGLLGNAANTRIVADFLREKYERGPVVLDPVMVSASGHRFLPPEAVEALKELMKLATVVTPNLPEAGVLSGLEIKSDEERLKAAEKLLALGAGSVLIKGGHGRGEAADDLLWGPDGPLWIRGPRIYTPNTHGTGCTLSSALAAYLAKGRSLPEAASLAKDYVTLGLRHSLKPGRGPGPLNHFHQYYLLES
jgi:hydroxymethylpyrimidine/phosphomethylpyrimidine kinase